MNLTYLRAFYTTVKCNSISKAAKELHMTQPGVSMQIQKLENEMKFKLLNRSNTGVSVTDAGAIILEFADSMLALEDNLQKKLEELNNTTSKLSIACCKSLGEDIMPCSIYTFKEIHCNVDVSMEIDNSYGILKKLLNHETNIGIIQGIVDDSYSKDLNFLPLMDDKLVLVGSGDCDLNSISKEELYNLPLILREEDSANRKLLESLLKPNGINYSDLNIVLSLNSPNSIKSSITYGKGFSFLPESTITHELRSKKLKKIKIENVDLPFEYYIAIRKNSILTSYEDKFIDFLSSKNRCFCY